MDGGRIPLAPAPASLSNAKFTEPAEVKVVEVARPASLGRVFRAPPRAGLQTPAPQRPGLKKKASKAGSQKKMLFKQSKAVERGAMNDG